jgi:hypothetical protein
MGLTRIGEQEWDFVNREGGETRLPPDTKTEVSFPTRWRIFGPTGAEATNIDWSREENYLWHKEAIPLVSAAVDDLAGIPEALTVGDQTFPGHDVVMDGDTLDLDALFGGHEAGQQAYAIAELEVRSETEVVFGAGCDWWMQWWIDGEAVFDTLGAGNHHGFPWPSTFSASRASSGDHFFSRRLTAGKHLIVVRTISGQTAWVLRAGIGTPRDETLDALPKSNRWEVLPDLNEIRPPALDYWTHTMAIRPDLCFGDVTMECEFKQPGHSGNVGFIFGAQDSGHYYWAQIPRWGQLWRARAFWAAISIADGSGYIRSLKMELMPNVQLHGNLWRTFRVERRGNRIQMWVEGVKGPCVTDETYGAGRVGIGGFAQYSIRNLKINGQPAECGPWPEDDRRGRPWINPVADPSPGDHHWGWAMVRITDDEIILPIRIARDMCSTHRCTAENSAVYLYHTLDAGRSWSQYAGPEREDAFPRGVWFVPEPGVIRSVGFDAERKQFVLRDSTDKGLAWSAEQAGKLLGDWDRDIFREGTENIICGFTRLGDGTFLVMLMHAYRQMFNEVPNNGQGTWGTGLHQAYCTRSEDRGLTWSEPVPMDHAAMEYGDEPDGPCGDFSETAMAELPSGRIVALTRPSRSPFMWQTHSDDGGRTWRVATHAPFSCAGGPNMVTTHSGYLALVARGPGTGLHYSVDGGVNWGMQTMIDYTTSFNGCVIEVEPDVILVSYPDAFDEIRPSLLRTQRIRITPEGPVPLGTA